MRLRFGVVLCLFAVSWVVGCRKPLTPNIDRNLAPETWITAAPMDTITVRDANGKVVPADPSVHVIPVRFHLYWAGSDADGSVVGFYYAVTETSSTPDPLTNAIPPLPGPKPRDYRYTTRTDTTFIFNVSQSSPDRQHAFFIYAVDNQGKPDPTPARFMFTALDKYPPTPIIDLAQGLGTIYVWNGGVSYVNGMLTGGSLVGIPDVRLVTDQSIPRTAPRDTVAVNARLRFRWRAVLGIPGSFVSKYCYRLEEPDFVCVPASVDSVAYPSGFAAGTKLFTLRTIDQAGGARDSTRRFVMNYAPDTWFSGPDPLDPQFVQARDRNGERRYIDLTGVDIKTRDGGTTPWPGVAGTMMSHDSVKVMPFYRQPRKTFFEIYNNRLYAHAENDTVHMNSWVVFYNGGYDKDSKYSVHVDFTDPALNGPFDCCTAAGHPDTLGNPVLVPAAENASPVGFRSQVVIAEDPNGALANFAQTGLYPIFEPVSVFRNTRIGGWWPIFLSGKGYAVARAEDGDGFTDDKVVEPHQLAELVDGGGGTPEERALREREVMTFYVNKPPFFVTTDPSFKPNPNGTTTFTGLAWSGIYLPSDDVDPYDPQQSQRPIGVPTPNKVLRYQLQLLGKSLFTGQDTTFLYEPPTPTSPFYFNSFTLPTDPLILPDMFAGGQITMRIQLCDCIDCERVNGQGRCISKDIKVNYVRTVPVGPNASSSPDRGIIR